VIPLADGVERPLKRQLELAACRPELVSMSSNGGKIATQTEGDVRFIQFPHPGSEHAMSPSGFRPWKLGNEAHARTFLQSDGAYRASATERDESGPAAFWGEWEGAARLVRELDRVPNGPRFLCRPDPEGPPPPTSADGAPAQNTDPFVWGPAIRFTFCRQKDNQKLRRLGRGSLILFGSSPERGFELDTVLVVAGWMDHRRSADLAGLTDSDHLRWTIDPMYGWGDHTRTYRLYWGATPAHPVDGMFSFVPCQPADTTDGFERPVVELGELLKRGLRMQARVVDVETARIPEIWAQVVKQVTGAGLALATRLELPRR
jgi:hypothetical protein